MSKINVQDPSVAFPYHEGIFANFHDYESPGNVETALLVSELSVTVSMCVLNDHHV